MLRNRYGSSSKLGIYLVERGLAGRQNRRDDGGTVKIGVVGCGMVGSSAAFALVMNGVIAFGLNVVSFTANKKTSALTMTVAGELASTRAKACLSGQTAHTRVAL